MEYPAACKWEVTAQNPSRDKQLLDEWIHSFKLLKPSGNFTYRQV
jgi:hypothetical protein